MPAAKSLAQRRQVPPAPVRTRSEINSINSDYSKDTPTSHVRHKSTSLASGPSRASSGYARRASEQPGDAQPPASRASKQPDIIPENLQLEVPAAFGVLSPPLTPVKSKESSGSMELSIAEDFTVYDFSKLDYELERAKVLGRGLWSTVYLADGKVPPLPRGPRNPLTPPSSPEAKRHTAPSSLFAVKVPARSDAKDVFRQEAKVLSHLMAQASATQYIVPFRGLDERNSALVFDAVIGGSLENLNSRLKQMTEVARHVELISLFPGLADDLISGLEFMHEAGIVNADIKPANVLLDISEHYSLPRPVVRARYIDFSASFRLGSDDSTANAGGTWDFMAPEQMRLQPAYNTPTFASDVWSLGITLLALIVGGSPYAAVCGDNAFRTREAIKSGDPLGFARADSKVRKRMMACQDFIDCCRQALKKDRERRTTAVEWKGWLIRQELAV